MAHTSGPWRVRCTNGDGPSCVIEAAKSSKDRNRKSIAYMSEGQGGMADACLIAAAPDLLETLEFILHHNDWHKNPGWQKAREVIAKAKGEQS